MIAGKIPIPSKEEMVKSFEAERAEEATLDDEEKMIKFQGRDLRTAWILTIDRADST